MATEGERPSEALFARLVTEDPARLVALLAVSQAPEQPAPLPPHLLTYAAEIAGAGLPTAQVEAPLLRLLEHPSAVVREGAIYGLAHHATDAIVATLQAHVASDPSPGVRTAAEEAANALTSQLVESLLNLVHVHLQGGLITAATDVLVEHLDRWLTQQKLERVRLVLERLDPCAVPPPVLTGVLSLTWPAKERLEPTRSAFFERVMKELEATWHLSTEQLASVAERLR